MTAVFQALLCWTPADAQAVTQGFFGQGTGPIYLTAVACGSTQNTLIDCPYNTDTSGDTHAEDAGVRCGGPCKSNFLYILLSFMTSCI